MIAEVVLDEPRTLDSGLVVYPATLDRFPGDLGEKHAAVLGVVHEAYLKQKADGFYPPDMTDEEFTEALARNPRLGLNFTLVRKGLATGKLFDVSYREASFRNAFDGIIEKLDAVRSSISGLPDEHLMIKQLDILRGGFTTREFDQAMMDTLSLRRNPLFGLWAGLEGRYNDRRGLKFDLQGWSTIQDEELSRKFSSWTNIVLSNLRKFITQDVIIGDAAIQAGLAAEMKWIGFQIPSQQALQDNIGGRIILFDNVAEWKYHTNVKPALQSTVPGGLYEKNGWEESLRRARRAFVAGHEVGHMVHTIPLGTEVRLGRWFQPLREIYGEGFAPWAVAKHPDIILSRADILPGLYFDLTKSRQIIKRFQAQKTTEPSLWSSHFYAAAAKLNVLLDNSKLVVMSNDGMFEVKDLNELRPTLRDYLKKLDELTCKGSYNEIEEYINQRVSSPVDFLKID